jgi:serine/threonine protein kinase
MSSSVFGGCRSVDSFQKINRIGEGTYGYVYRAIDKETSGVVALKRLIMHNEDYDGFPLTSLREIKLLKRCNHPNIVKLIDIVVGSKRDAVFLMFEYCEHDLAALLTGVKNPFKESEIKCLVQQLLSAVEYIHRNWIIHRDIKLSNLLYNSKGQLKLADFGLARTMSQPSPVALTQKVVTLWYRSPELLLGCETYTLAVDIWSVGCIMGELLLNRPMLAGDDELQQLQLVFKLLGKIIVTIFFATFVHEFKHRGTQCPHLASGGIDAFGVERSRGFVSGAESPPVQHVARRLPSARRGRY